MIEHTHVTNAKEFHMLCSWVDADSKGHSVWNSTCQRGAIMKHTKQELKSNFSEDLLISMNCSKKQQETEFTNGLFL